MSPYEKVQKIMDKYHIFGECVSESADTVAIEIRWGDWKHEHLCLRLAVQEEYPDVMHYSYVTEEDGSDCYSAVHYFIFQ